MKQTGRKQFYWLLLYYILAVAVYFSESLPLKMVMLSAIFYTAAFLKRINIYLLYLAVSVVFATLESSAGLLVATMPVYFNRALFKIQLNSSKMIAIVLLLLFAVMSYSGGLDSQLSTMLVYFSCILVFLGLIHETISIQELYKYVILLFLVVGTILFMEMQSGNIIIRYGRLAINDNIRELADLIAIPSFLSFAMLGQPKTSKRWKYIYGVVGIISSFILFLTLSKGAVISVIAGLCVVYVLPRNAKSISLSRLLAPLVIVAAVYGIVVFSQGLDMFHYDRLLEQDEGFSGRTDIWEDYYELMRGNSQHLLFGLGPGDLKRLSVNGFYAHSMFLDVFFSYGIMMSALWLYTLVFIFREILKSRSVIAIGLFMFSCLLYSTHGVCTNVPPYILIGVSYILASTVSQNTVKRTISLRHA